MDCNLNTETFVTKLDIEGKTSFAKICISLNKIESDLFSIQVFSDDQSWSGRFSYKEAESFGDHIQEDIEEYSRNVRDALKINNNKFKYELMRNEENVSELKFKWKRTFTDSTATLLHGFVILQRDEPNQTRDNIIEFLIDTNKSFKSKIQDLEHSNELLNKMVVKCNSELEKFVDIKESLESTLYGKFVQILNSKKRRILLLENHIADIENADSSI